MQHLFILSKTKIYSKNTKVIDDKIRCSKILVKYDSLISETVQNVSKLIIITRQIKKLKNEYPKNPLAVNPSEISRDAESGNNNPPPHLPQPI